MTLLPFFLWACAALAQGTSAAGRADSLHALGNSLFADGAYVRADSVLRDAVIARRETMDADSLALAGALVSRSRVAEELDLLDVAEAAAREAIGIYRRHRATDAHLAGGLYALAKALARGEEVAARPEIARLLAECLELRRRAFGDDHPVVLETRFTTALVDPTLDGQEVGLQERLFRECLADQRRVLPKGDPGLVEALYWLSERLKNQGEPEEALELAEEALDIMRRHKPHHPWTGYCTNQVATIHTRLKQYRKATMRFEESVALQRRVLGPEVLEVSLAETNLATAYAYERNVARAESLLLAVQHRAIEAIRAGRDFKRALGHVDYKRAWVAERAGRFALAESLTLVGLRSEGMKRVPETHTDYQRLLGRLGRARAGLGDWVGAETYLDDAVRLYERARSVIGLGNAPATFDETPYETRALVRLERGRFDEAWRDVETSRGRLLGERLQGGSYTPADLPRVQAALSADEAVVGWIDHALHHDGGRSWAYVIRRSGPVVWERLPRDPVESADDLGRRYATFRDALVEPGTTALGGAASAFPRREAQALWNERLAPVERHLADVARLVLVPSSAMGGIPVGALVDERGRMALERWSIQYSPSMTLRTMLAERRTPARPRSGLFVGDPPFRESHLAAVTTRRGLDPATVRGALRGERVALGALPRLRWTRDEVRSIATLFPTPRVLVGDAATEAAISDLARAGGLAGYDVVHFATHALMDGGRPERSALVLSQLGRRGHDGVLTAREIGDQWKLGADLVTLSACETALGRNILGEGTVGFAYPLIQTGAKSVLASLWSVNDESSQLLMRRFYTNWLGATPSSAPRMTKAKALRDAQLWVRDWRDAKGEQPYRHPYYWSAFILIGD